MKILIATDGSESAYQAQHNLARAGLPESVEAMVLSIADVWLQPETQDDKLPEQWHVASKNARLRAETAVQKAREIATADADRLRQLYPKWLITVEAAADSPGWGIITRAEQWDADLIVVGSHGISGLGRLILGSVSQMVLTHSRTPVRIGRSSANLDRKEVHLIIGIDGSLGAKTALDQVLSRNWPQGTEVELVAVIDPRISTATISDLPDAIGWVRDSDYDENTWVRNMVELQSEKISSAGLQVSAHIQTGDPKRILVERASESKADCIFLGARGLTRIERFLLGSVSAAVSARAGCSVEVVRRRSKKVAPEIP